LAPGPARYKPLSVGVVLLDLVPAARHQPDLFAVDNHRRQKLSPLVDRINDRYGRCAIGFGLFPADFGLTRLTKDGRFEGSLTKPRAVQSAPCASGGIANRR
jgi:hypothetical protein